MSAHIDVPVSVPPAPTLPTETTGGRNPILWAVALLLIIELDFISVLIMSYFYLRATITAWPPPGYAPPSAVLPSIALGFVLIAAGALTWANATAARGDLAQLWLGVAAALVLGVAFVILIAFTATQQPFDWSTNAYGSIFFLMIGSEVLSGIGGIFILALVLLGAWQGRYTATRRVGVQVAALYWYFVAGFWLLLYLTLVISPRLM